MNTILRNNPNKSAGFTLIEVLIALAILAIAFTAVIKSVTANTRDLEYIQNKTIANWVGLNTIARIQLGTIQSSAPDDLSGQTKMFNQTWYWQANTETTDDNYVNKITVKVSQQANGPILIQLVGFMRSKPHEQ